MGNPVDPHCDEANSGFFIVATPQSLALGFQQVGDPTPGKNRIHFDLSDPDGNLFCVSDLA